MRPQTIVNFERIVFVTLILGLLQSYLDWDRATRMASIGFVLTVQVFTFGLIGGLALLVARRRSNVSKWILIVMFAIGLPPFVRMIAQGITPGSVWISVLQTVGQLIACGLLFTASARSWLSESN